MTNWLHIVGQRYGQEKFVEEAHRIGIQRAVPVRQLSTMAWGDTVYLGVMDEVRNQKRINVFGYFQISTISIVRNEQTTPIIERLANERHPIDTIRIQRECGSYLLVAVNRTGASLHEYYEALKDTKGAKVLIGVPGLSFREITPIILKEAMFFRGYRQVKNLVEIESQTINRLLYELDDYHLA